MRGKILETYYRDYYDIDKTTYFVKYTQYPTMTGIRFLSSNLRSEELHEGEIVTTLKLKAVSTCHEYVLNLIKEYIKGK